MAGWWDRMVGRRAEPPAPYRPVPFAAPPDAPVGAPPTPTTSPLGPSAAPAGQRPAPPRAPITDPYRRLAYPVGRQAPLPVATTGQYDEAVRRRRDADQQVGILEKFEGQLSAWIQDATDVEPADYRPDYLRELLARRISVRARLEEAWFKRERLRGVEDRLRAALPAS